MITALCVSDQPSVLKGKMFEINCLLLYERVEQACCQCLSPFSAVAVYISKCSMKMKEHTHSTAVYTVRAPHSVSSSRFIYSMKACASTFCWVHISRMWRVIAVYNFWRLSHSRRTLFFRILFLSFSSIRKVFFIANNKWDFSVNSNQQQKHLLALAQQKKHTHKKDIFLGYFDNAIVCFVFILKRISLSEEK